MTSGILRNTMAAAAAAAGLAGGAAGLARVTGTARAVSTPRATVSHAVNFQPTSRTVYCGIVSQIPGTALDPGTGAELNGNWPGLQCSAAGIGPKHPTEGDPFVHLGQGTAGRAKLVEVGDDDLASSRAAVTLKPGATWSRDGISCTIAAASVTCTNAAGHGFSLATGHLKTH